MSPRTGRPPSDNPRSGIVRVRVTVNENELIRDVAEAAGLTVSDWARAKLVAAAKRAR